MAITPVRDEAHWHELRAQNIGGSDAAALIGMSPWKTKWQLWMEKAGKLSAEDLSNNKNVQAGTFLESGIAAWAAHRWGMKLAKVTEYHTVDDIKGMGASLDYADENGIPVEIKWSARGHGWEYKDDQIIAAPDYYIIQVQHQMACVNAPHGWLVALIDNEPRRMLVPRHEGIINTLRSSIAQFWDEIESGVEPNPDFSLDAEAISQLMGTIPMADIELGDEHAGLYYEYNAASALAKEAEDRKTAAKAQLLFLAQEKMQGSNANLEKATVRCGEHKMTITTVAPNMGTEVTQEMVGTRINTRRGYQMVRIS